MDLEGLSAICAGLGVIEEDGNGNRIGYTKAEYCSDNLKDLLRFMRRDDPQSRDVFKQVCRWNTVSKDLIPMIEHCQDDRNLVLNAVKILVFLTMPIEPSSSDIPQQIEYLWGLKSSITCSDIVAVIVSLLESPLENLERDALTEDDWKLMQLILTLFKNILAIQEISLQQKAGGTVSHFISLRDRFLELLFRENVMDLIIVITQHFGGYLRNDNLLLLEIFHYIFLGQEPELIAKAHRKDSKADEDTKASINSLKSIMEEEEEKRRLSRARNLARHSHFVGTFTRLTMDGSKAVFNGKPTSASRDNMLKPHKVSRGPTKAIAWNHGKLPPSNDEILGLLHDFVNQFLSGGYNVLMQSLRGDIEKEHPAIQKSDVIVFFQVAQFATSFQYYKFFNSKPNIGAVASEPLDDMHSDNTLFGGDICGPIAASMNESMFQLVFSNWRETFEGLKETQNFNFISAAGSLMKIMIGMLDLVLNVLPEDSKESQTARILLYKLFYDQTDQGLTQFLLNLLKSFDAHKQTKSDLEDLVEIISKVLHLMENLQARGTLRVAKKSRKGRKKKAPSDKETKTEEQSSNQNETEPSNTEKPAEVDSAPEEVRNSRSDGKEESVAPAHADNEGSLLEKDINGDSRLEMDHKSTGNGNDDPYGTGDSSGDEQVAATGEVDLNVSTLISSFANHNIVQKLCWLLKFYKSNSTTTNDYIIGMLRRISDDLELSPTLYQLSLLTIFYDILLQQKASPSKEYANIVNFLTNLVRKMLKKMKKQPLLFVEALFWKTRKECHYIESEYLVQELCSLRKETKTWGQDSGDVDIGSSEGWARVNIADALGDDEADIEIGHELRNDVEKSVDPEPGKISKIKKRIALGSDLDERIRDLYERFKNSQDCISLIAEDIDPDGRVSSLQVSKKLKQLGLQSTSRKRIRHVDNTSAFDLTNKIDGEETLEQVGINHDTNNLEQSTLSGSKPTRKRVRPFSEDQEATIRVLYEQFKDKKRCSSMIAYALDADNKYTASQVSRKLKQLGLYIPRQKRSQTSMHLSDEDLNDFSAERDNDSDDEPLLSLVKRSKKKDTNGQFRGELLKKSSGENFSEDDSDDEVLASVVKGQKMANSRQFRDDLQEKSSVDKFSEDDSEDEVLASVVKRKKMDNNIPSKRDLLEMSSADKFSEDNSDDEVLASVVKSKKRDANRPFSGDLLETSFADKFSEDDSGDEVLATVVKKRKVLPSKPEVVKRTEISSEAISDDDVLGNEAEKAVEERDVGGESSEPAGFNKDVAFVGDTMEDDESLTDGKKPLEDTTMQPLDDSPLPEMADDLEDSEDEMAHSEPSTNVNRRRMVLDFEDDD